MATNEPEEGGGQDERDGKPIHQVHESNLPLKPDRADPYGMQARWALARYAECPLKEGKDTELVDGACRMIWKKMAQVMEGANANAELKTTIGKEDLDDLSTDYKAKFKEVDKKAESQTQAARLMAVADIYRHLASREMRGVRKCAAYPRVLSDEELEKNNLRTGWKTQVGYIIFPMVLFFCCFAIQSFLLHVTTALYVRYMDRLSGELGDHLKLDEVEGGEMFDLVSHLFVATADGGNKEAVRDGNVKIPMAILDLSGIIPAGICAMAFAASKLQKRFHIGLWYKTFLVACCMALIKGVLDVVTVLPDSIGWEQCKERLGDDALMKLRDRQWFQNFLGTLWQAILDEILGVNGKRMRYCADMMVSGHTYFAALFSLAAYKLTAAVDFPVKVQYAVLAVCVVCLLVEMALVAAARFHYTVDMMVSVLLVCLLWDSLRLEQVASDLAEGYQWRDPERFQHVMVNPFNPFQRCAQPPKTMDAEPQVLPSQATHLINMRMLSGRSAWEIRGDLLETNATNATPDQAAFPCCESDPLISCP